MENESRNDIHKIFKKDNQRRQVENHKSLKRLEGDLLDIDGWAMSTGISPQLRSKEKIVINASMTESKENVSTKRHVNVKCKLQTKQEMGVTNRETITSARSPSSAKTTSKTKTLANKSMHLYMSTECCVPEKSRNQEYNSRNHTPGKQCLGNQGLCDYETNTSSRDNTTDILPLKKIITGSGTNETEFKSAVADRSKNSYGKLLPNIKKDTVFRASIKNTSLEIQLPAPSVDASILSTFEPLTNIINKLADGQNVPPQTTMQYEMLRFCTLRSYPKENKPFITRIAQAGFYFASSGDELVCYCCGRRRSNWTETDVPLDVHRKMNPNCRFFVQNAKVNVPIKVSADMAPILRRFENASSNLNSTELRGTGRYSNRNFAGVEKDRIPTFQSPGNNTTSGQHGNFINTSSPAIITANQTHQIEIKPVENAVASNTESNANKTLIGHSTVSTSSTGSPAEGPMTHQTVMPKYPKYSSITVRITSFSECAGLATVPESLAEAGFLYAGFGDCVRCFQCGVGLRHWSSEDDPWIEHARWSKDCVFVRQTKGQEFVNLVQMAVQYSHAHEEDDNQISSEGSLAGAREPEEMENMLHTDAAQSVLEMGYHPNIIRRAIRKLLEMDDRTNLKAVKIMEKIFEIENVDELANEEISILPKDQVLTEPQNMTKPTRARCNTVGKDGLAIRSCDNDTNDIDETPSFCGSKENSKEKAGSSACSIESFPSTPNSGTPPTNNSRSIQILEKRKIKEENEKLKLQSKCTKCKQNDVCIVFLPCGHLITCEECAPSLKYCSVHNCGKYIKGTVRTYLA